VSDISNVFAKVFVREFYRLNAGFFIIVITLTFGFMSGVEHKALAEFFIASPLLTLIPIAVWTVYTLKVIVFNNQRLGFTENHFLFASSQLSYPQQALAAFQSLAFQFTPVILYGSFLIAMGMKHNLIPTVTLIASAIIILISFSSFVLLRSLKTPIQEPKTSALKNFIDKNTIRPVWWIYTITVLRKEPLLFVGTKIFTGLLLFAVMQLYINQDYDERLLAMAAALAGVGNVMIMMQLQFFDFKYFTLIRNLPLTLFQRYCYVALITCIFILPEGVLIVKYSPPLPLIELTCITLVIPALALLVYALLYLRFANEETYGRLTFALAIAHLVLILFKVPVFMFVILNVLTSWILFKSKYYTFEILPTFKK
jgi:hypothetical protein